MYINMENMTDILHLVAEFCLYRFQNYSMQDKLLGWVESMMFVQSGTISLPIYSVFLKHPLYTQLCNTRNKINASVKEGSTPALEQSSSGYISSIVDIPIQKLELLLSYFYFTHTSSV